MAKSLLDKIRAKSQQEKPQAAVVEPPAPGPSVTAATSAGEEAATPLVVADSTSSKVAPVSKTPTVHVCSCGNKFFLPTVQLDPKTGGPAELNENPPVYCPACQSVWQYRGDQFVKLISRSNLSSLRMLSNKV